MIFLIAFFILQAEPNVCAPLALVTDSVTISNKNVTHQSLQPDETKRFF
uniref:Uncharacterized protein n=1 Tax=Anguilla anguilla TaxID=7936 RepID=A0A0E9UZ47_ANGAN